MIDWHGCYSKGWQGEIVPEAFSHPAKFSRALIRRIYAHALECGYLREGDVVVDPFDGVALGALDAMFHGLHHIGCELEEKFVQLGQQNIDLWNRRYGNGKLRRWGTAVILQGDSRNLVEVLEGARAEGIIASPPFSDTAAPSYALKNMIRDEPNSPINATIQGKSTEGYGTDPAQLGNMPTGEPPQCILSSPPYADIPIVQRADGDIGGSYRKGKRGKGAAKGKEVQYNIADPAQLGNMPTGEPPQAVIGSPPYANRRPEASGSGVNLEKQYQTYQAQGGGASFEKFCATQRLHSQDYGTSDGQLAAMREGDVDAVIASPPYLDSGNSDDRVAADAIALERNLNRADYGQTDGQLAALPEGEPPAGIVSSPPWEASLESKDIDFIRRAAQDATDGKTRGHGSSQEYVDRMASRILDGYGQTEDNLGNQQGNTFWSAARLILLQCHQVLAPGGVAIWVVKDFVRNKKRIDFTGQWRALCESCGFETVEVIRAWLVEERGTQYDLTGEGHTKVVERKSFFRRLYEFKARAAKFWESVTRDDKAGCLWHAHGELWQSYHEQMLDDTRESPPPLPTRTRILMAAQALAYREAGEPDVKIDTQIDYEMVLVMRKAA